MANKYTVKLADIPIVWEDIRTPKTDHYADALAHDSYIINII